VVHDQPPCITHHFVPYRGGDLVGIAEGVTSDKLVTGAGDNYRSIGAVQRDITQSVGRFVMRFEPISPDRYYDEA
jgi:hypothetical protein